MNRTRMLITFARPFLCILLFVAAGLGGCAELEFADSDGLFPGEQVIVLVDGEQFSEEIVSSHQKDNWITITCNCNGTERVFGFQGSGSPPDCEWLCSKYAELCGPDRVSHGDDRRPVVESRERSETRATSAT